VGITEILILLWLLRTEGLAETGLTALVILGVIATIAVAFQSWPLGCVSVIVVASAMPRYTGTLFGLHVRAEHVAIGLVCACLVTQGLRGRLQSPLHWASFDYLLICYVSANFVSSALTSPAPHMTLRWAVLNALVIVPYFLLRYLVRNTVCVDRVITILLLVGTVEAAFGILCFVSNRLFDTTLGVDTDQYGLIPGTHGTQYEANLFGSYTACCAVMCLALYFSVPRSRRNMYGWGFAICLLAALVSMSRSVILALPLAILFVVWIAFKGGHAQFRTLMKITAAATVLLVASSPFLLSFIAERFSTIDLSELAQDNTAVNRLVQTAVAVEDVRGHLLLGMGTSSFQLVFDWDDFGMPGMKGETEEGGWISNSPLRILHDTGILGLTFFLLFLGALVRSIRMALKRALEPEKSAVLALSAGLILYAITFQATEATMLSFTWVHFGLLAVAVLVIQTKENEGVGKEAV
jgi:hypothetical protein